MRLHLRTSSNTEVVPFDYQRQLTGALHKWLGQNEWHDGTSLYSFSWLQNGKGGKKGLQFPEGAHWFISAHDPTFIKRLVRGIQDNPEIAYGLHVREVHVQETPTFRVSELSFRVASPVFVKQKDTFFLHDQPESTKALTQTLRTKLKAAGLSDDEALSVRFDTNYAFPRKKLVTYNGIQNKASLCPVIISGKPETLSFAWDVGVGNSTGIGFGALH